MSKEYDPVEYNDLKNQLNHLNEFPDLVVNCTQLKRLSEAVGKQVKVMVKNDNSSVVIVFEDSTYISIKFTVDAYCKDCDDKADDIHKLISFELIPTFNQLINTGLLSAEAIAEYSNLSAQLIRMDKAKDLEQQNSIERREKEQLARLKNKYE